MIAKQTIDKNIFTLQVNDSDHLHVFSAIPKNFRAIVILVHGFAEHKGRYEHIIDLLASNNYACFIADLRGHGHSFGKKGHILDINHYLEDLSRLVSHAKKSCPNKKIFLVAHSLGGLIAFLTMTKKVITNIDGIVLSAPAFGINIKIPKWKLKMGEMMSKIAPSFSMKSTICPTMLSKDKTVQKIYKKDSLIIKKISARLFTEMIKAHDDAKKNAKHFSLPVFFQLSGQEKVVSSKASVEVFNDISSKDKTIKLYDSFLHELYHELDKEKPINDMIEWLNKRV